MELIKDILADEARYASESDDNLLAEMAAGHVDELSVTAARPTRQTIRVPIVEAGEDKLPECCCVPADDATGIPYGFVTQTTRLGQQAVPPAELGELDAFEISAERDALLAEPEIDVAPDSRPEYPEPIESPVKHVIAERSDESGAVAAVLLQLCWVLGGCVVSGVLYWLLLA